MALTSGEMTPADIAAVTGGGCRNDGWGGEWSSWIIVFLIFAMFGWGGNGFGGFGGNAGATMSGYATQADIQRGFDTQSVTNKLNGLENGLCDGFYAVNSSFGQLNNTLAQGFAGANNQVNQGFAAVNNHMNQGFAGISSQMNQGFAGLNTAIVSQGYENQIAANGLQSQMQECCCATNQNIDRGITQGVMNTNTLQNQIQQNGFANEKATMEAQFTAQQNTCATLQAIDKVGDRIIDYLAADKAQALRDENQALRLAASQSQQNAYLVNQLRPNPVPAYNVPNPYCCYNPCGGCSGM